MLLILPVALLAAAPVKDNLFAKQCGPVAGGFEEAQRSSGRAGMPVATLMAIPSFCTGWTVVLIERHWPTDRNARSWWTIRYTMRALGGAPHIRWADSRRCPAMRAILVALDQLPLATRVGNLPEDAPAPPPAGRPLPPPPPPPPDGTDYTLRGYFQQPDRSSADVTLRTTYGPLARWAENIAPALQACWSESPPDDPA